MNVELEKNRKPRDSGCFFVLLVLFQMVTLPAGVLKVVSLATYELYDRSFWNNHYAGMLALVELPEGSGSTG